MKPYLIDNKKLVPDSHADTQICQTKAEFFIKTIAKISYTVSSKYSFDILYSPIMFSNFSFSGFG